MKNEVETEGKNLQVQIYDRSRQNTAELFIFVPLLSCTCGSYYFCAVGLPSNAWLLCAASASHSSPAA